MAANPALVAQPRLGRLPLRDAREPIRVVLASLAPGGAERIVLDWLGTEAARGREVHLAVLHPRRTALAPPRGVRVRLRARESPDTFLRGIASHWRGAVAPVSVHLLPDALLGVLWESGLRTVPVIHNAREGWRNDPSSWACSRVPLAVACADVVREQAVVDGCAVPIVALRHRPRVGRAASDPAARRAMRAELGIGEHTFVVGVIGALKAQKDPARAVAVLEALVRRRDAVLVLLGGLLDRAGLGVLDGVLAAAVRRGVADRLRLPGFVSPVEPWLAAFDALLNVSRYEGLSIATQEALAAGLPVVATDVGGQRETRHAALELLPARATAGDIAARLAVHPVRSRLEARPVATRPRVWSVALAPRPPSGTAVDTLFVTANLNAGGAQRSLVNLAQVLVGRHAFAVAVCAASTQDAFASALCECGAEVFQVAAERDDCAIAESVLAHAWARRARNLVFWNVAPGVKLLVARFAPPALRLIDACPGAHAYAELESAREIADATAFGPADYYRRLDVLVTKFRDPGHPPCRHVTVIPNGVALRASPGAKSRVPRFLVSGRIAPSKRLETIVAAFAQILDGHPEARLEIVGQAEPRHAGYLSQLLDRARGLPVTFRGPRPDLAYLDEPWSAAVVLGTHQGCPNAVLEAMAGGVAVIANASGGTAELVRPGITGWLLPEDCSPGTLARALAQAAGEPDRARRMGAEGRALVARAHSLHGMASRYLSLLAHTLSVGEGASQGAPGRPA